MPHAGGIRIARYNSWAQSDESGILTIIGRRNATWIKIGIGDKDRRKIADGQSRLPSDTFLLYLKNEMFRHGFPAMPRRLHFAGKDWPESFPLGAWVDLVEQCSHASSSVSITRK